MVLHMSGCHLYLRCCSFLFIVMSLLSSWDKMDVPVELLADDAWLSEDDKTGFFECWSGLFWLIIFVKTTNILDHDVNYYKKTKIRCTRISEKSEQMKKCYFFDKWSICFLLDPPLWKRPKSRKMSNIQFWWMFGKYFLMLPVLPKEYNLFIPNNESSLEQ